MPRDYPPWIAAYLCHAVGADDAPSFVPTGYIRRCATQGPGSCGRLGYWYRQGEGTTYKGERYVMYAVVWDGKTVGASPAAIEYGMVDPERPYGLDTGVSQRLLDEPFRCGWCGKSAAATANRPPRPQPRTAARPAPDRPTTLDDARRAEIEAWADKLDSANPVMAQKVRSLADLPPPKAR